MAAFVPKDKLDSQSVGKEIKRLAEHVNSGGGIIDNVPAVATADGSDPATTMALANALKASHNTLLAELKEAGLMVAD